MKQILGFAVIALLAGILIFNFVQKDDDDSVAEDDDNVIDVSGDTDVEGATIVSPGKTGFETSDTPPDFKLKNLASETVKLSDLKGKKIFLNFWASWCAPCRLEMPEMQQFYEEHQDEVEIIAVNVEPDEEKARKYVKENDFTYPILLDKKMKISDDYAVFALPTTYFIGTDGKIQEPKKTGPMTHDFMVDMLNSLK